MDFISVVQDTQLKVQGTRIEFGHYCSWCGGVGYEPDERGDVTSCCKCQGSGFQFRYIVGDK